MIEHPLVWHLPAILTGSATFFVLLATYLIESKLGPGF